MDNDIVAALWDQINRHQIDIQEQPQLGTSLKDRLYYARKGILSQTPDDPAILNFCNLQACSVFGYEERELIGLPSIMLVPEKVRQARNKMFGDILRDDFVIMNHRTTRLHKNKGEIPINAAVFRYEFSRGIYSIAAIVEPCK